ncbi:MAG: calcium-binding protein [Leptolyngbyaceae cyanobacterium RU_5_1]|nr:calcium-binding protein [Leptolyngbyaceae cyanobacterium RU_5_1]
MNNIIKAGLRSSLLLGGEGNDSLIGSNGNDTLDGGTGNDTMQGGLGNDTYLVNSTRDQVTEAANAGIDTVQSSVNFTLGENLENLVLRGTDTINGTGNNLANTMTGNNANNNLDGKEGNDILNGGGGNDILIGGLGLDSLNGGAGDDVLIGGDAADRFIFNSGAAFTPADLGVDLIKDFQVNLDKIVLSQSTFGAISAAQIAIVANDGDAATSAGLITYSVATGNLFFNQNGAAAGLGTGGQFASLDNAPLLSAADFQIVA